MSVATLSRPCHRRVLLQRDVLFFSHLIAVTCIDSLSFFFPMCKNMELYMPKHTQNTHTELHFIGLTTDKLSLKPIFFPNITSCSVQLREVIITLGDVDELSPSAAWIFSCKHSIRLHVFALPKVFECIQASEWQRSLTLHRGCYGWVNFLLCCLGRQTLSLFFQHNLAYLVDVFTQDAALHSIFSRGGPARS